MPRTRVELPQPPPSHITGVKLPYESLDCSVEENKDFSQLLKSPYCLYCTEATEDSATEEWSVVEQLLCLRLYDVFAADEDTEYSMAQIVERISRCIRTRSVAAVAAFLRAMFLSHGTSPIGRDHENQSTKRQKLSKFSSVKRFKNGKGTFNAALRPQKSGYDPCDHNGPCSVDNGCSCKKAGANCEKYCGCSFETCSIRFEGCRCKSTCTTGACPCAASGRECDPDLCSSCGAGVHPCFIQALKKDSESSYRMCGNVALRRGDRKRVAIGRSDVQGWGLFICEPASKGELIIEYKGEVISNEEAERRGVVYDKIGCSYLFDLANDLVVDSTRLGNAVKFMNHSDEKKSNCFPEIKVVDGEQRIGLYARRPIIAGEELTFDYKYTADAAPQWAKGK